MAEQQIILKKKRRRTGFTQVPNDLLDSNKISGLAKALWCLLFSKPEDWTFYWGEILSNFKEGRDSVKNAAKELEKFGYLTKTQTKKSLNGKMVFSGMEIELDDQPELSVLESKESVPVTEFQSTENSTSESPSTESPSSYKDLKKKDLSKQYLLNFLSLPAEEKKDFLRKEFWEKLKLKSNLDKYCIAKARNDWKGFTNLEADVQWWENGFLELNPHLKKSTVSKMEITEKSPEIRNLEGRIKNAMLSRHNATDFDIYFYNNLEVLDGKFFLKREIPDKFKWVCEKFNFYEKLRS